MRTRAAESVRTEHLRAIHVPDADGAIVVAPEHVLHAVTVEVAGALDMPIIGAGLAWSMSATTADTIGVANEVPLTVAKSFDLSPSPLSAAVVSIKSPGAATRMEAPGVLNGVM